MAKRKNMSMRIKGDSIRLLASSRFAQCRLRNRIEKKKKKKKKKKRVKGDRIK
jgi:hypothetical protein